MGANRVNIGKETEQIEFNKSTAELRGGVISIAAILNKHGSGDLYFGVKNDGDVVGQTINESTLRDVSQAVRANIRPEIYPVVEEQTYGDRAVVHVRFEGSRRPYLAYRLPYIRVADEDVAMDQGSYDEALHNREIRTSSWETQFSRYDVSNVDVEVFKEFLEKAREAGRLTVPQRITRKSIKETLAKLELAEGDRLLNAGAALFVDCGINELQMAKFASDKRLTFTDIRRYTGSIVALADRAVQYIVDAMDWRVEFDGSLERKEIPEVPIDAVREAVINAFAHRIIESRESVEAAVYKSYIDIYSPGPFPEYVSPEQFVNESRKPIRRNPLIAKTLYYSKDMENFATGLKRIYESCQAAGVQVDFLRDGYGFTVRFHRHCGDGWEQDDSQSAIWSANGAPNGTPNGAPNETQKNSPKAAKKSFDDLCRQLRTIIMQNPRITRNQMGEELGVGKRTIQRLLNAMPDVHFTGSSRNWRWVVDSDAPTE